MATAAVCLTVREDGSVALPDDLRAAWHLIPGDQVEVSKTFHHRLNDLPREEFLQRMDEIQARWSPLAPEGRLLSDELMDDRAAEARREQGA